MRYSPIVAFLLPLLLSGCGTIANSGMVYGGTVYDVGAAKAHFGEAFGPRPVGPDFRDFAFLTAVAHVVDVPLSAAADTLCLPFTLAASMREQASPQTTPADAGR